MKIVPQKQGKSMEKDGDRACVLSPQIHFPQSRVQNVQFPLHPFFLALRQLLSARSAEIATIARMM